MSKDIASALPIAGPFVAASNPPSLKQKDLPVPPPPPPPPEMPDLEDPLRKKRAEQAAVLRSSQGVSGTYLTGPKLGG